MPGSPIFDVGGQHLHGESPGGRRLSSAPAEGARLESASRSPKIELCQSLDNLHCIVGSITVLGVELSLQSFGLRRKNSSPPSWHISWYAVRNLELDRWKISHLSDEFESLPLRQQTLKSIY